MSREENQKPKNQTDKNLSKEDLEIEKLKAKIDNLKKQKKERIAKEKEKLKKQRNHRLIVVGGTTEKMLDAEGEQEVRVKIAYLLKLKNKLAEYGIKNYDELEKFLKENRGE